MESKKHKSMFWVASEWKIKVYRVLKPFKLKNFSFLQQPQIHDDQCTFKWILNTDCGFKAVSWTLENLIGNVQYYFEVAFNF